MPQQSCVVLVQKSVSRLMFTNWKLFHLGHYRFIYTYRVASFYSSSSFYGKSYLYRNLGFSVRLFHAQSFLDHIESSIETIGKIETEKFRPIPRFIAMHLK